MEFVVIRTYKSIGSKGKIPGQVYVGEDSDCEYNIGVLEYQERRSHDFYWETSDAISVRAKKLYVDKTKLFYNTKKGKRYLTDEELNELKEFAKTHNYHITYD